LIIAQRSASSISAIFRTRTSSIIYKNYITIREGMGQLKKYGELGKRKNGSTEKVWRVGLEKEWVN
jgi:hypothetical protein